ncbi:MAG: ATP-binding protein, partial [Coriobacteriales bacterium]
NEGRKKHLRSAGITAVLYIAGMLAVYGFSLLGVQTLVVFPVFILGIVIASIETDSGVFGAILGVLYLVSYDYLFTMPRYGLAIVSKADIIALAIFLVIALIMNTLTQRLRKQLEIAERDAAVMSLLTKVSTGLINSKSPESACSCAERFLREILKRAIAITYGAPDKNDPLALECYEGNYPTGYGEAGAHGSTVRFLPLSSKENVYGVISIDCSNGQLDQIEAAFLTSLIKQTTIAIERNLLENAQQQSELAIERERFKTTLLRSVSHDLRTPLTSISGNVEYLLANENAPEKTRRELLESIQEDASWLRSMVDNLLSMTRIEEPDEPIQMSPEIVDDVVADAAQKTIKRKGAHELTVKMPEDILVVPMNSQLISQVLINLIDNAFKHSRSDSHVEVAAWGADDGVHFAVSDDGGGIDPAILPRVFDRFCTTDTKKGARSGMGLGLSICKGIVEAHGGTITARNNEKGGATFEFVLPAAESATADELACEDPGEEMQ